MNTTTIAKKYLAHGFSPIPLIDGEKRPSIRNWQQYGVEPMGLQEAESLFQNTGSIGLVMGFDGIQCLDIDATVYVSAGHSYTVVSVAALKSLAANLPVAILYILRYDDKK